MATVEARPGVWRTALPLAVPGPAVACGLVEGGCGAVQWRAPVAGLTVPNLSLVAFALVVLLVGAVAVREREWLGRRPIEG